MLVLALETSTTRGGVAIGRLGHVLTHHSWERGQSHSELVTSAIERVVAESGITLHDLDLIAVDRGPGSFTGIRVGINAARALGYSLQKRVFVADSLTLLAHGAQEDKNPILALLNAHKNLLYAATFQPKTLNLISSIKVLSLEELDQQIQTPHACVGEGYLAYEKFMSSALKARLIRNSIWDDFPDVQTLAKIASQSSNSSSTFAWNEVIPLYLRGISAEEKLRDSRDAGFEDRSKKI